MSHIYQNESFQRILTITENLIQEKGCHKTTLKDIIESSGMSKGAIYHYVKSKNELLGHVLKAQLEAVNQQFQQKVQQQTSQELGAPLEASVDSFILDKDSVSNKIFIYLLGYRDDPKIAQLLQELHDTFLNQSIEWIQTGIDYGVIPSNLDAKAVSEKFLTLGYGLRIYSSASGEQPPFSKEDIYQFMFQMLKK
ncbi:TetR/AcrR family transcriptional regulator [Bacillus tianshenii]|nr:TetR/AcrR family transcriptional regulator [Bacillus tianshenii]